MNSNSEFARQKSRKDANDQFTYYDQFGNILICVVSYRVCVRRGSQIKHVYTI